MAYSNHRSEFRSVPRQPRGSGRALQQLLGKPFSTKSRAADVLLVLKFIWSLFLLFWLWSKESITFYHSCWTSDTGGRFCVVLMMMVVLHCYNAIKSPLQRSYYITSESTGAPTFDFLTSLRFLRWTETTMDNPQTIQTISCCSLWLITCYQYVGEHDVTACLG